MNLFLSIIVPIYKIEAAYLRKCLDSLKNQSREDYRVILVDDGSPDDCGKICDEYVTQNTIFKVIHQKNQGVSAARNNGINAVDTPWLTFVDPDDWVEPDFVATLFELKNKDVDIALYDYYQEFTKQTKENHLPIQNGFLTEEWVENVRMAPFHAPKIGGKYYNYEYGVLWNKLYRTELIKKNNVRFVPEARKGQDALFNAAVYQYTPKFYYSQKALYHYRYLQESVTNRFNDKIVYYNEVSFSEKERILKDFHLPEKYWTAYYSHVLTRFYSYLRLYYFHSENKITWKEKKAELDALIAKEPYVTALKKFDSNVMSHTQQIFTYCLKKRMYFAIWLLVKGYQKGKTIKGETLRKGK